MLRTRFSPMTASPISPMSCFGSAIAGLPVQVVQPVVSGGYTLVFSRQDGQLEGFRLDEQVPRTLRALQQLSGVPRGTQQRFSPGQTASLTRRHFLLEKGAVVPVVDHQV